MTSAAEFVEIILPPTNARYVRIKQHGRSGNRYWSIHQLGVCGK